MISPERVPEPADGEAWVCWQCEAALAALDALCAECGVVQPPPAGLDPFARLGLTPNARLTTADVAARRLELLDRLHPDRFAAHSPVAGQHAHALATAINDAARALRDPLDRLAEIFRLRGIDPEPVAPTQAFFTLLQEFQAALIELRGVDAHAERDRLGREVAHRFQAIQDALAIGLETPDFPEVLASERAVAEQSSRPASGGSHEVRSQQSEPANQPASAAERRGNPPDSLTFSAVDARRALGDLVALRGLLDQLEALDTTPDRLGRRRT